jgi:hypothetical protein
LEGSPVARSAELGLQSLRGSRALGSPCLAERIETILVGRTVQLFQEHVEGRTVNGVPPTFSNFTTDGFYVTGGYFVIPKKLQAVVQWQYLNPGQKGNDGLYSILGGLNYYIRGDNLKLMVNYIHTWSDFRAANPQFGDDQFDEVIGRMQLMF